MYEYREWGQSVEERSVCKNTRSGSGTALSES